MPLVNSHPQPPSLTSIFLFSNAFSHFFFSRNLLYSPHIYFPSLFFPHPLFLRYFLQKSSLFDIEADEEEEDGLQTGLGDFGFGSTTNFKEKDDERVSTIYCFICFVRAFVRGPSRSLFFVIFSRASFFLITYLHVFYFFFDSFALITSLLPCIL